MLRFQEPNLILDDPSPTDDVRVIVQNFLIHGKLAVLGGGALRDLFLGRPVKDFDIFVRAQDADDNFVMDLLRNNGFDSRVLVSNESIDYLKFTDVASVIESTHPLMPVPVQVIRMHANNETPERMIERLDFGPCQIGMDGDGRCWVTEQFIKDVTDHKFTATRTAAQDVERSIKRFERLKVKYPGWELVLP